MASIETAARLRLLSKAPNQTLTPLEQARRIANLAQEKLAEDVVILDMRPACSYTDFFVICTGRNARQTKAIWDEVHERLKHEGRVRYGVVCFGNRRRPAWQLRWMGAHD